MKNGEILQKAIEKAVKNGYGNFDSIPEKVVVSRDGEGFRFVCTWSDGVEDYSGARWGFWFEHDFAKAFWKSEEEAMANGIYWRGWKIRLQEMVLEENPLQYLAKYL